MPRSLFPSCMIPDEVFSFSQSGLDEIEAINRYGDLREWGPATPDCPTHAYCPGASLTTLI